MDSLFNSFLIDLISKSVVCCGFVVVVAVLFMYCFAPSIYTSVYSIVIEISTRIFIDHFVRHVNNTGKSTKYHTQNTTATNSTNMKYDKRFPHSLFFVSVRYPYKMCARISKIERKKTHNEVSDI